MDPDLTATLDAALARVAVRVRVARAIRYGAWAGCLAAPAGLVLAAAPRVGAAWGGAVLAFAPALAAAAVGALAGLLRAAPPRPVLVQLLEHGNQAGAALSTALELGPHGGWGRPSRPRPPRRWPA